MKHFISLITFTSPDDLPLDFGDYAAGVGMWGCILTGITFLTQGLLPTLAIARRGTRQAISKGGNDIPAQPETHREGPKIPSCGNPACNSVGFFIIFELV